MSLRWRAGVLLLRCTRSLLNWTVHLDFLRELPPIRLLRSRTAALVDADGVQNHLESICLVALRPCLQNAADFMLQQEEAAATATAAASAARRRREREGDSAAAFADEELYVAAELLKAKDDAFRQIPNRNISVPDLLKELGQNDEQVKSIKKKITGTDNVFREIMEESFALLPEDAPEYDEEGGIDSQRERASVLSDRERAAVTYAGFSETEKLQLLDEKIRMLNRKLDEDYALRGGPQSLMYVQLRDHLQAAKVAYQERRYVEDTERRLRQAREKQGAAKDCDPTGEQGARPHC